MVRDEWNKTDGRLAARCAAVASFGAGVIHFAVAPAHWNDWVLSGLFLGVIALLQLVWAFFAWSRPIAPVLGGGIAANAGLIALWVSAHTSGAPFGPLAGHPAPVTPAGIAVQLLQCYVIMGAGWAWIRGYQAEQVSGFNRVLVLVGANTVMIGAVTVGLASSFAGHQHSQGTAPEMQAEHHVGGIPAAVPGAAEQGLPVTDMGLHTDATPDEQTPPAAPADAGLDEHRHHG